MAITVLTILLITVFKSIIYSSKKIKKIELFKFDKNQTKSITGFFVILVFISHFRSYAPPLNQIDNTFFNLVFMNLGQLIVAPFLFFSGYGTMVSLLKKEDYLARQFTDRFFKIIFKFWIALLLFLFYQTFMGVDYKSSHILKSFLAWESMGNSNWYVFLLIYVYISVFISFGILKDKRKSFILMFILQLLYIYVIKEYKPLHWYDTSFTFLFGMLFCYNNLNIRTIEHKSFFILLLLFLLYFSKVHLTYNWLSNNFSSVIFVIIISYASQIISYRSKFLEYISNYSFEIYLYQRLIFSLLRNTVVFSLHIPSILLICFLTTLFFSIVMSSLFDKLFKYR